MITQEQVYAALLQAMEALGLSADDFQSYGHYSNSEGDLVSFSFYGPGGTLIGQIDISV